jgi:organic radical activating enzyme
MNSKIELSEVFSSIQGEGIWVGCRQVFVRLAKCNLNCSYCDTAATQQTVPWARLEQTAGHGDFILQENAVPVDYLAAQINKLLLSPHHSVSLTGGEPLCQAHALHNLAAKINAPLYLETNGTLPEMLDVVLAQVKYISMDFKLPSSTGKSYWQEHGEFLEKAVRAKKDVFVKIVVTAETTVPEIETALSLILSVDPNIPLVIQPVTLSAAGKPLAFSLVEPFWEIAAAKLAGVRLIPQTHKILGVI